MALQYTHVEKAPTGPSGPKVTVDRHWYLTEDKDRVVPEGDPACRWLWATPGMEVSLADAERLGAVKAEPEAVVADEPEPAAEPEADEVPEPEEKQAPTPPNKQRKAPVRNKQT